jgi:hypothetical protein
VLWEMGALSLQIVPELKNMFVYSEILEEMAGIDIQ